MSNVLFQYNAALYCEACGKRIRAELDAQGKAPADPEDEETYDSADYPKEALAGESDSVNFCDGGAHCADAITLKSGHKIGAYLTEDLTDDGVTSLRESLARKDLDSVLRKTYQDIAKRLYVKYLKPAILEARLPDGTLPQFSSVGGYTIGYYTFGGDILCAGCAIDPDNEAEYVEAFMEGAIDVCTVCNKEIESAYGDPDEDKD